METTSGSSSSQMRVFEKPTHKISHKNMETTSKPKNPTTTPIPTQFVRLCIKSQDGDEAYFKTPENQKVRTVLQTYCNGKQMDYKSVVFLHDGKPLRRRGTIQEVGLVDQDVIDAVVHQTGG